MGSIDEDFKKKLKRYCIAKDDLQSSRRSAFIVRFVWNVHSKTIVQNIKLVAKIPQILNPLHFVETIIDKKLIKKWNPLRPFDHDIRLQKTFFKTRHVNDWLIGIPVHPIIWQIILHSHNERVWEHG